MLVLSSSNNNNNIDNLKSFKTRNIFNHTHIIIPSINNLKYEKWKK